MRIVFMGTPAFAATALAALQAAGHTIVAAYSQPPRPAGRGQKLTPSPVQAWAEAQGIPTHTPRSLKDLTAQATFAAHAAEVAVVAAYGLLLPQAVLDAPRWGCLNIHASLLPRWRGAAPIQRAILAGDTETGITIMQMEAGLDTGPMLLREALPIHPTDTTATLHDRLADLGGRLITQALAQLPDLQAVRQDDSLATYAAKIHKDEARLVWTHPASHLARGVRAFAPAPGAWCLLHGERLKVLAAEVVALPAGVSHPSAPGMVLDDQLLVACGDGAALRLRVVQRPGKAALPAADFLRGTPVEAGCALG